MEMTWPSSATNNSSCSLSSGVMCALTCAVLLGRGMGQKEEAPGPKAEGKAPRQGEEEIRGDEGTTRRKSCATC
jgi:hypothetical protein